MCKSDATLMNKWEIAMQELRENDHKIKKY